jgi:hypothetical protein
MSDKCPKKLPGLGQITALHNSAQSKHARKAAARATAKPAREGPRSHSGDKSHEKERLTRPRPLPQGGGWGYAPDPVEKKPQKKSQEILSPFSLFQYRDVRPHEATCLRDWQDKTIHKF